MNVELSLADVSRLAHAATRPGRHITAERSLAEAECFFGFVGVRGLRAPVGAVELAFVMVIAP